MTSAPRVVSILGQGIAALNNTEKTNGEKGINPHLSTILVTWLSLSILIYRQRLCLTFRSHL